MWDVFNVDFRKFSIVNWISLRRTLLGHRGRAAMFAIVFPSEETSGCFSVNIVCKLLKDIKKFTALSFTISKGSKIAL